ncbi:hypothetical protein KGF57_000017 [Candida theae]|uniref:Uncharacterized protein n=1 Tax=Candida theae TaxID=1198502 RepID=A0AAD5BJL9_9ASCO|nr:uncharacterized protein KGF57_000017 [Candida theae]KAI5968902.1 hypothetical protein KGF57_000017 [Candida theae]
MDREDSFDAGNTTVVSIPRSVLIAEDRLVEEPAVDKDLKQEHHQLHQEKQKGGAENGEVGEEGNNILDSQINKPQTTTSTKTGGIAQAAHSPSISSISSLESDSSTSKLIQSFSKTKLTDSNKENQPPPPPLPSLLGTDARTNNMTNDWERPALIATSTENNVSDNNNNNNNNNNSSSSTTTTFTTETTKVTKLPQSVASKTNFYNDLNSRDINSSVSITSKQPPPQQRKKPVKFTVRKVSHEAISSPSSPSPDAVSNGYSHSRQSSNGGHQYKNNTYKSPNPSRDYSSSYPSQYRVASSQSHSNTHSHSPQLGKTSPTIATSPSVDTHELETRKKLSAAQHKYDQYETRIVKIDKEIQFLSNLLPPYTVDVDYTTRVKIQRAIDKLRGKQDELARKKYGLGITISRLWRATEGSEIWVRKVD